MFKNAKNKQTKLNSLQGLSSQKQPEHMLKVRDIIPKYIYRVTHSPRVKRSEKGGGMTKPKENEVKNELTTRQWKTSNHNDFIFRTRYLKLSFPDNDYS